MSLHGIALRFTSAENLTGAAQALRTAGFRDLEAYTPYPVEKLNKLLKRKSPLASIALIGGLLGGLGGFYLQYYISVDLYPVNVGGRPLLSWPAFVPITFEMTILGAGTCIFLAFFFLTGLPRPHHPIFGIPLAERISDDAFVLCLEATDPKFAQARDELERVGKAHLAVEIIEVPDAML